MSSAASFRSMIGVQPSSASTSDSVLVIIDAQNEYATGKLRVSNIETSRAVNASLLGKYRAANAPVVHVVHATPEGAPVFTPGTELAQELSELTPRDGESVVTKHYPGSFTDTDLQSILKASGRSKVVLTGYMVSSHPIYLKKAPSTALASTKLTHARLGPRLCFHDRSPGC